MYVWVCVSLFVYMVTYFTARSLGNSKFQSSVNLSVSSSRPQRVLDLRCVLMMDDIRGTICCVMLAGLAVVCGFRGFDPMSIPRWFMVDILPFSACLSQILLPRISDVHRRRIMIALLWKWVLQYLSCRLDVRVITWVVSDGGFGPHY